MLTNKSLSKEGGRGDVRSDAVHLPKKPLNVMSPAFLEVAEHLLMIENSMGLAFRINPTLVLTVVQVQPAQPLCHFVMGETKLQLVPAKKGIVNCSLCWL